MVRLLLVTATALTIFFAGCSGDDSAITTSSPVITPTASNGLKPADAETPASGICPGPSTFDPVTVEFHTDIPAPHCLRVLPSADLRFVNKIDRAVNFELGAFKGTLQPDGEAVSQLPAGQFLAPGVHTIKSTAYGDGSRLVGSGEVWLVGATAVPTPILGAWSGAENAYAADRAALLGEDKEAWFAIDPETGEPMKLAAVEGHVPQKLAGGRYDLIATQQGTLARLDVRERTLKDVGVGWTGEISADGRWAAVFPEVEGDKLAVVDVDSGQRYDLGRLGKPVFLTWSSNDTLAIVRDEKLYLAAAPDWNPREVGPFPYVWPVWSPDSQWLTVADQDGVRLLSPDLQREQRVAIDQGGFGGSGAVAWSPDGRQLAIGGRSGWYVVNVHTRQITRVAPNSPVPQGSLMPFWSPDGSAVAFYFIQSKSGQSGIAVALADGTNARVITTGIDAGILVWTDAGILVRVSTYP